MAKNGDSQVAIDNHANDFVHTITWMYYMCKILFTKINTPNLTLGVCEVGILREQIQAYVNADPKGRLKSIGCGEDGIHDCLNRHCHPVSWAVLRSHGKAE